MSTRAVRFTDTIPVVDESFKSSASPSARLVRSSSASSSGLASSPQARGFHSFQNEVYYLPNDDAEHNRLNLQDSVWKLCLHGGLHTAPLQPQLKHVVDIGTGTASWAFDFARAHPDTHVLGTDLTPVQVKDKPANTSFVVANANEAWDFGGQLMDYIHSRTLLLGVPDWRFYFEQAFRHTRPGGWVEVQEPRFPAGFINDGGATDASPMKLFADYICEASAKLGPSLQAPDTFEKLLETQGFVNVQSKKLYWALGEWPEDPREKEIGRLMAINIKQGLLPVLATKLLRGVLNWSEERVKTLIQQVEDDIDNPLSHFYLELNVCCAQKPT